MMRNTDNMNRLVHWFGFISFACMLFVAPTAKAQGTYTARSCNYSDVNAIINGPTHIAVNGDTFNVPGGNCTWTSGITVPSGVGISIIGEGTPSGSSADNAPSPSCQQTVINMNFTTRATFLFQPNSPGDSLSRLSCMQIQPTSGVQNTSPPVQFNGSCTSSGCPNFRADNLTFPNGWSSAHVNAGDMIQTSSVFGVVDHNSITGTATQYLDLVNIAYYNWLGIGQYGDNSWPSANAFGTNQAVYIENNTLNFAIPTDADVPNQIGGGGRFVVRFNVAHNIPAGFAGGGSNHGTETTGRARGGRSIESYENQLYCDQTAFEDCLGVGPRSGVVRSWGNNYNVTGSNRFSYYLAMATERTYRPTQVFMPCTGLGPFDVNDGATTVGRGTISSISGSTLNLNGITLTANALNFSTANQTGTYYTIFDSTTGALAGIASNGTTSVVISWNEHATAGAPNFASGDTITIFGTTIYAAGTVTGASGSTTLTDSNASFGNLASYSVTDVTQGYFYQIGTASTSTTLVPNIAGINVSGGTFTWNNGDAYVVTRATRCLDQPNVSGSSLLSGTVPTVNGTLPPPTVQNIDPSYEFDETFGTNAGASHAVCSADSLILIANRDFYCETLGQAVQSSSSSPFDGTSGVGHGTLANRPSTCTSGVGYFATDQGSWNSSGGNNPSSYSGQGQFFKCTSTNAWTLDDAMYTYPHPLVAGGTVGSSVNPPTSLEATVQ